MYNNNININIERQFENAKRENKKFIFFFVTISNYEEIIISQGKAKAEDLSVKIKQVLQAVIDKNDLVELMGAGIFAVSVEGGRENLEIVKGKIKRAMKKYVHDSFNALEVNFALGISFYPENGADMKSLLEKAQDNLVGEKAERLSKNIMIVDDEAIVVDTLKRSLQIFGYRNIDGATGKEELLKKIEIKKYDIIVLDVILPGVIGFELIEYLKNNEKTRNIPILIMSGYDIKINELKGYFKDEFVLILSKPFELTKLKEYVDYLL